MADDLSILIPDPIAAVTPLSEEELILLKVKLWQLLGQMTERYTMGDSSSVPVETAEELFNSVCFTLSICLKANVCSLNDLINNDNLLQLLKAGQAEIEKKIAYARSLLLKVIGTSPKVDNISYYQTINGITAFFKRYDYRFMAHAIPADIDYQLCQPVADRFLGIEYIIDYLQRLLVENQFINCFDNKRVKLLLLGYCPDYQGLLINLYDPVATNAIGLALCGKNIFLLDISAADRWTIMGIFAGLNKQDVKIKLTEAAQNVCEQIGITNAFAQSYLQQAAIDLAPRIMTALSVGDLSHIFISLPIEV